ncbi:MAG: GAF domain-containing sensor histidine kinase [Actinomycetota bacterium]
MELRDAVDFFREVLKRYSEGFSLEEVLGSVVDAMGGTKAILFSRRPSSSLLEPMLTWNLLQGERESLRGRFLPVEWVSRQPARRFLSLDSRVVSELGLDELARGEAENLILFPIRSHAYLRAVLVVSVPRGRPIPDPQSFQAAAVSVVLEKLVEMFSAEDRMEEIRGRVDGPEVALGILSDYLLGRADVVQAASLSLDLLIKMLNMEGGTIHRIRYTGGERRSALVASRGWGGMPDIIEQLIEDGLLDYLQEMRSSGERQFSLDAGRLSEAFPVVKPYFHAHQVKSFLLTPIFRDDLLVGLLALFGRSYAAIGQEDMELLAQVTHRLGDLFAEEELGPAGERRTSRAGIASLVEDVVSLARRSLDARDFVASCLRLVSLEISSRMSFSYRGSFDGEEREFLWFSDPVYGGERLFQTTPGLERTAAGLHRMAVVRPDNPVMREMPVGEQAADEGLILLLVPARQEGRFLLEGFYLGSDARLTKADIDSLPALSHLVLGLAEGVEERRVAEGYRRALERLAEMEADLSVCEDLEGALRVLARGSRVLLESDRALVVVMDRESGTFRGMLETRDGVEEVDVTLLARRELVEALGSGRLIHAGKGEPGEAEDGFRRLVVPLAARKGVMGALLLERLPGSEDFMDYQKRLACFLAGQATTVMEALQERGRWEVRVADSRALLDIIRRLVVSQGVEDACSGLYQYLSEQAGIELAVFSFEGKTGSRKMGWWGEGPLEEGFLKEIADAEVWISLHVSRLGRLVRNNLNAFYREPGEDLLARMGIRSYAAFPLSGEGFRGFMLVGSGRSGALGEREARLAEKATRILEEVLSVPLRLEGLQSRVRLLEDMCRRQEEKLRTKTDLINLASHEIRHPLTLIMGFSEVLREYRDRLDGRESQEIVEKLGKAADRLRRSVVNMMEVSRLESGKLVVEQEEVDVAPLLEGLAEELRARNSDHLLELDIDAEARLVVADRDKLEIVLFNLMDNAVKYSPPGTQVEVFTRREGRDMLLGVRDQGPGISEENLNRIFEPFRKGEGEEWGTIKGMGLGLYIVNRLVEAMGGRIEVHSERGKGSTFIVRIPQPEEGASSPGYPADALRA